MQLIQLDALILSAPLKIDYHQIIDTIYIYITLSEQLYPITLTLFPPPPPHLGRQHSEKLTATSCDVTLLFS